MSIFGLRGRSAHSRAVRKDWAVSLSGEKGRLFQFLNARWDEAYGMLSVTLDEAFHLRSQSDLVLARQHVANSTILMKRFSCDLLAALRAVEAQGRHFGTLPAVTPLEPDNFRGETARNASTWSSLLLGVLFSERLRFFFKLRTLMDTAEDLAAEFQGAAGEIVEGTTTRPAESWDALECLHYDLNTCFQESKIVMKSFLLALPDKQVAAVRKMLESPSAPVPARIRARFSRIA